MVLSVVPTAKLQSPCPPIPGHREPSWSSVFRPELTCGLGHTRDLVGQPHARQAEEGGQETEDLRKREGPGGAQGKGQSRRQPFQRLIPVPVSCTGCGREGARGLI